MHHAHDVVWFDQVIVGMLGLPWWYGLAESHATINAGGYISSLTAFHVLKNASEESPKVGFTAESVKVAHILESCPNAL